MKQILTLIITACSIATTMPFTSVAQESDGIKIHCLNPANKPLQKPLDYKNVRIVELKNAPLLLQTNNIQKLEMNDNCFFIQASENLYTYTLNGELMTQIGKKGERKHEYSRLTAFYIDSEKGRISIVDNAKNKLITYNFWGDCILMDSVPESSFQWNYQTLLTCDNKLLSNNGMGMGNVVPYFLFDLEKRKVVKQFLSYQPITTNNYLYPFSWHPMARIGKDIDMIMPLCDTVYTYSAASSSLHSKYIIETIQKMASKDKIRKNTPSYSNDILELNQQGYFTGFNGIYETDTKVLLQYQYGVTLGYFLFDKTSRTGNYYLYASSDKDKILPFYVISQGYKNNFVSYVKGKELRTLSNIKDKSIRKQIENLKDNSICLILYEL